MQVRGEAQTPSHRLLRLSAAAGVLASLLLILGSLQPAASPTSVTLLALSVILAPVWLTGVYQLQRDEIGRLGLTGYLVWLLGIALVTLRLLVLLIGTSTGTNTLQSLMVGPASAWFVGTSFGMFVWGAVALGTASIAAGVFPRPASALWMVGLMQTALQATAVSGFLAGVGIAWSSYFLWKNATGRQYEVKADPRGDLPEDASTHRQAALDALRGLMMILMAIDHASLYIRRSHPFELWNVPVPRYDGAGAFLTRFVTHPCAPGFFFLMGVGIILYAQSRRQMGWSQLRIAQHLALRGILFILLEQIIVDPVLGGEINFMDLQVLYGLGGVMVVCALLVSLGRAALLAVGLAAILVTQVLPTASQDLGFYPSPLTLLLLVPGGSKGWFVLYPVFPWLGVAALGMAFGHTLLLHRERGYRLALWAGGACLLLFPVVRFLGGFGNLRPVAGDGWIDFLNVIKYPPSLVFLLITLGIDLTLLGLFARAGNAIEKWGKPLLVFGRTALYFFLIHWFLYGAFSLYFLRPGTLLPMVVAWGAGLVLLYPICREYGRFKQKTSPDSLWRFL